MSKQKLEKIEIDIKILYNTYHYADGSYTTKLDDIQVIEVLKKLIEQQNLIVERLEDDKKTYTRGFKRE